MELERVSKKEQEPREPSEGVFDFGKMTSTQAAALIEAMAYANTNSYLEDDEAYDASGLSDLDSMIGGDLERYAEESPNEAFELFNGLVQDRRGWPKVYASSCLGPPLLRRLSDQSEKQSELVKRWVDLLRDEDKEVREHVSHTLAMTPRVDWPDERVADWVDNELAEEFQNR